MRGREGDDFPLAGLPGVSFVAPPGLFALSFCWQAHGFYSFLGVY